MYEIFLKWLQNNQQTCFYRQHYGFKCFGCGFQTSIIELLKGHFLESIKSYPALIPLIFMFIFIGIYIFKKNEIVFKIIKYLAFSVLFLIISNFLLQFIQ